MCKSVTESGLSRQKNKNTVSHMACWDWSCQEVNMGRPQVCVGIGMYCIYHIVRFDCLQLAHIMRRRWIHLFVYITKFVLKRFPKDCLRFFKGCFCLFKLHNQFNTEPWVPQNRPGVHTQHSTLKLFSLARVQTRPYCLEANSVSLGSLNAMWLPCICLHPHKAVQLVWTAS